MKKLLLSIVFKLLILILLLSPDLFRAQLMAQSASLHGVITDKYSGEAIPFATVVLKQGKTYKYGNPTDLDGNYMINKIDKGTYSLVVSHVGYQSVTLENIIIREGDSRKFNVQLQKGVKLDIIEVRSARKAYLSKEVSMSCYKISPNEINSSGINAMPGGRAKRFKFGKKKRKRKNLGQLIYSNKKKSKWLGSVAFLNPFKGVGQKSPADGNATEPTNETDYDSVFENLIVQTLKENKSTFSVDVDVASYANIRRHINSGRSIHKSAVRIEEMINYFNYEYEEPHDGSPFAFQTEVAPSPWNVNKKLVHIGIKGMNIENSDVKPNNLVFLVDVSGSMSGSDRLWLIQRSLNMLVDNLGAQDFISLVVYAGSSGLVLKPTPCSQKAIIKTAINELESGGSTAGAAGIELAYYTAIDNFIENGNNRVILCTDGDFNVGVSSESGLIQLIEKKRESGVFLSVLGVGVGNYQDQMMEQLADHGNGNCAYLDDIAEARKVLVDEMHGTLQTIAKDVKIQVEFDPKFVKNYRLIGYENRMLENEDFEDDTKDAGEIGAGHTVTALYEVELAKEVPKNAKLVALRIRYKNPQGIKSKLLTHDVLNNNQRLKDASENLRFSAAVATFGMMLRESKYLNSYTLSELLALTNSALGKDSNGYRREFLDIVNLASGQGLIAEN
ncbi:MAG: von Willebrand factor type A domain-containing protein [Flavobacteriales bacterium]|nr:von Willebrand factor type A domain-containing protein [Flavobacteriales bacterium]